MDANHMIYDFETALRALIDAQSDVMTLVQKWEEMIADDPRLVTFDLKGQADNPGRTYNIPNIQRIIETLNSNGFPRDPTFDSVNVRGQGGAAKITNSALEFISPSTGVGATYDAYGIDGRVWTVSERTELTRWPIPRYWAVKERTSPTVTIRPALPARDETRATDFFVQLPRGTGQDPTSITLQFAGFGATGIKVLEAGPTESVWHVFVSATFTRSGLSTTGHVLKMEG